MNRCRSCYVKGHKSCDGGGCKCICTRRGVRKNPSGWTQHHTANGVQCGKCFETVNYYNHNRSVGIRCDRCVAEVAAKRSSKRNPSRVSCPGCGQPRAFLVSGGVCAECARPPIGLRGDVSAQARLVKSIRRPRPMQVNPRPNPLLAIVGNPGPVWQSDIVVITQQHGFYNVAVDAGEGMVGVANLKSKAAALKLGEKLTRDPRKALALSQKVMSNPARENPGGRLTADQVRRLPTFSKAVADFKKMHGAAAELSKAQVLRFDDGKKGVTRKVMAVLGPTPELHYLGKIKGSNKYGDHWRHPTNKKSMPVYAKDPETGLIYVVPVGKSRFRLTDWMRG